MTRKDALWMAGVAAGGVLMGAALAAEARRARRAIELDGRAALVTGGSRGLGLLIARELGRDGARGVLMARDQAELDRAERKLRGERVQFVERRIAHEVCEAVAVCGPARMVDQDH